MPRWQHPTYERVYRLRRGLPQVYAIGHDGQLALIEMGEMLEDEIHNIAQLL